MAYCLLFTAAQAQEDRVVTHHEAVCIGFQCLPHQNIAEFGAGVGEHDFCTPTSAPLSTPSSTIASGETMVPFSQMSFLNGRYGYLVSPMRELQEALGYVPSQVLLLAHVYVACSTHTSSISALGWLDVCVVCDAHAASQCTWLASTGAQSHPCIVSVRNTS